MWQRALHLDGARDQLCGLAFTASTGREAICPLSLVCVNPGFFVRLAAAGKRLRALVSGAEEGRPKGEGERRPDEAAAPGRPDRGRWTPPSDAEESGTPSSTRPKLDTEALNGHGRGDGGDDGDGDGAVAVSPLREAIVGGELSLPSDGTSADESSPKTDVSEGRGRPLTAPPSDKTRGVQRFRPARREGHGRPLSAIPSDKLHGGRRLRPTRREGSGRPASAAPSALQGVTSPIQREMVSFFGDSGVSAEFGDTPPAAPVPAGGAWRGADPGAAEDGTVLQEGSPRSARATARPAWGEQPDATSEHGGRPPSQPRAAERQRQAEPEQVRRSRWAQPRRPKANSQDGESDDAEVVSVPGSLSEGDGEVVQNGVVVEELEEVDASQPSTPSSSGPSPSSSRASPRDSKPPSASNGAESSGTGRAEDTAAPVAPVPVPRQRPTTSHATSRPSRARKSEAQAEPNTTPSPTWDSWRVTGTRTFGLGPL